MNYSFAPIVDPNTVHTGFYFVLAIVLVVWILNLIGDFDNGEWRFHPVYPVGVAVIGIAAYVSYYPMPVPRNIEVIGELVDQYSLRSTGPKAQVYTAHYVTYRVPGGEISFVRNSGVLYPNYAILYKN